MPPKKEITLLPDGTKVVPLKKTYPGYNDLAQSGVWKKAQQKEQPYLYYNQSGRNQHTPKDAHLLCANPSLNGNDYFAEGDFILYEDPDEIKEKPESRSRKPIPAEKFASIWDTL